MLDPLFDSTPDNTSEGPSETPADRIDDRSTVPSASQPADQSAQEASEGAPRRISDYHIGAFYRFIPVADPEKLRAFLLTRGEALTISGTMILSKEGVNGTLAGSRLELDQFLNELTEQLGASTITVKYSHSEHPPFKRFKIKIKPEIVTLKAGEIDPNEITGIYVDPADWNALISDPEVLVLDTRNDFEVQMGTFERAVNPGTEYFRHFPEFVKTQLDPGQHKKVAMFCTGGIRCEKASAFLLQNGFPEVYQLDGGILNYLEKVDSSESLWRGDCFVFDDRVAVDETLKPTANKYPPRPGRDW
jgi:UPF0176 protein